MSMPVFCAVRSLPLIALILGFDAIVRERGSLDLLRSYPVTRLELPADKYLGLVAAHALLTQAGLAPPATACPTASDSKGCTTLLWLRAERAA